MISVGIDVAKDKHDCFIINSEGITVILIHALSHHPDSQPEAQDEVLARCDVVDLMLCLNQPGKEGQPSLIKLFRELLLTSGNLSRRPHQIWVVRHLSF